MDIAENMREFFNSQIGKGRRFQVRTEMARFLDIKHTQATTLYKFLDGANTGYTLVVSWFVKLGGQIAEPDKNMQEYELIPKVDAEAGAGESLLTSDHVQGMYAFRKDFLHNEGLYFKNCVMMDVAGHSMEPLLRDGDTILINSADTTLKDGQIHVVGMDDNLMVKRLLKIPGGWRLCSANPEYGDTDVVGDEVAQLRLYGRVRWVGRVL